MPTGSGETVAETLNWKKPNCVSACDSVPQECRAISACPPPPPKLLIGPCPPQAHWRVQQQQQKQQQQQQQQRSMETPRLIPVNVVDPSNTNSSSSNNSNARWKLRALFPLSIPATPN